MQDIFLNTSLSEQNSWAVAFSVDYVSFVPKCKQEKLFFLLHGSVLEVNIRVSFSHVQFPNPEEAHLIFRPQDCKLTK